MKKIVMLFTTLLIASVAAGCGTTSETNSETISSESVVNSENIEKLTADEFTKKFTSDSSVAESENQGNFFEISGAYAGNLFEKTIQMSTSENYDGYSNCELRFEIEKDKFDSIKDINEGDIITLRAKFKCVTSYTLEFGETEFISLKKAEISDNVSEMSDEQNEMADTVNSKLNEPDEHNSTSYVDYLTLKAKADAETASDENIENAINYIIEHKDNLFSDNEVMENAMYYGRLIECKYKDTKTDYEKLGWQTLKTIKYVYIGEENINDEVTQNNLAKLIEIIDNIK